MDKAIKFINEQARLVFPEVVELRRDFHAHPELSFEERRTAEKVSGILERLGLEIRRNVAGTGVVGLLRGSSDGPTIGLRADMDALPVTEDTGLAYASRNSGVMHACNHDGHMAILLGAAMVLSEMRQNLKGNIKFIFQPGEEGFAGARQMIEEGVLDDEPRIDAVFALHLDPMAGAGTVLLRDGPIMACGDVFNLSIIGKGGHGALPHRSVDPIHISGHVITALQGITSRRVNALDSVIISICTIHGGERPNIIPDRVEMGGTVRLFDRSLREKVPSMMEDVIRGVTSGFGADYSFNYIRGYPATVNDADFTGLVESAIGEALGRESVHRLARPRMPSEDFSFFLERIPGTYLILGARSEDREPAPSHSAKCSINEAALETGVKVHAAVAVKYLEKRS